jgi:Meckel syndrome type 1 protein
MAEQIIRKVDGQTTRFDIQLDPLGLGQVDVRIEIGADGQLKAAMTFETQSAANELQARAGELKRALEDAGFNLGGGLSFEVSRDPNGSSRDLAQQNQQQHQAQQDSRSGGSRAFQAAMERADNPEEPVRAGEIYLQRRTQSGIDVRI